jgi:hypothetical protein
LKKVVAPLKEGEEKTHSSQQHWISMFKLFFKNP